MERVNMLLCYIGQELIRIRLKEPATIHKPGGETNLAWSKFATNGARTAALKSICERYWKETLRAAPFHISQVAPVAQSVA